MNKILFGKPVLLPHMLTSAATFGALAADSGTTIASAAEAYRSMADTVFSAVRRPDELLRELGPFPTDRNNLLPYASRVLDAGRRVIDHKLAALIWADPASAKQHDVSKDNAALVIALIESARAAGAVSNALADTFAAHIARRDTKAPVRFGAPVSVQAMLESAMNFHNAVEAPHADSSAIRMMYRDLADHVFGAAQNPPGLLKELRSFANENDEHILLLAPAVLRLARKVVNEKLESLTQGSSKLYELHGITKQSAVSVIDRVKQAYLLGVVTEGNARLFIDHAQHAVIEGRADPIANTRIMSRAGMLLWQGSLVTMAAGAMMMPQQQAGMIHFAEFMTSPGTIIHATGLAVFAWTVMAEWLTARRSSRVELS